MNREELGSLDDVASDVPGEQTADPEEAFAAEPYIRRVEPAVIRSRAEELLQESRHVLEYAEPLRRDELAEERASRYTYEDGTPK